MLRANLLQHNLPLTSGNFYSEVQSHLIRAGFISSQMAQAASRQRRERPLDAIRQKYGVFTSFLISEKTTAYYHFDGNVRDRREANPDAVWYYRVKQMRRRTKSTLSATNSAGTSRWNSRRPMQHMISGRR